MKTCIYYFSGTGNSLVAARDLAERIGDTQLVSIPKAMKAKPATDADRVGLVFPVYMFGLPLIVVRFCQRVEIRNSAYVFGVATCGGTPGATMQQLKDVLIRRNLALAAGFAVKMPGNYTPLYGAKPKDKQEALFAGAKLKVARVAEAVAAGRTGVLEKNNPAVNFVFSALLYRHGSKRMPTMDKRFWSDEKCNGCGLCERVCPVRNVRMEAGRPAWLHHCEQCMACLQWCPQEAIQYGRSTVGRRRYHHPAISAADLAPE